MPCTGGFSVADTRYLFRLDDACPWMDHARWAALEALFDRFHVKPIVGVVPCCADPDLKVAPEDPFFWDRARGWQSKGWSIGLHGYNHVFTGRNKGLVPLNDYTEFAGRPESEQREKIRGAWAALMGQGLTPQIWVAPAHTFDRTTLRCLQEETPIRVISDGLSSLPFRRWGMTWVPQQMWRTRTAPSGVWTICLHPNEMDQKALLAVEAFLRTNGPQVISVSKIGVVERNWSLADGVFEAAFRVLRGLKQALRKIQ